MNFYQFHLNADNDYWHEVRRTSPAPNATENSPVNQKWNGASAPTRASWRNVAGSDAQYTIELLPAHGHAACVEGDQASR